MATAVERREALKRIYLDEARDCVRCALAETRTNVVFGAGDADADLMFVGEAPGRNEDEAGLPFVGQAGKLLDRLLGEIGLERGDVFIANTIKCRPPGNRDPQPGEIDACQDYLRRQVELIEPKVVCTLGNFATKLLRGDPTGITRVHGQPEVAVIGERAVRLFPLFHPAAALYTPSTLDTLREDFARIPALLARAGPRRPPAVEVPEPAIEEPAAATEPEPAPPSPRRRSGMSRWGCSRRARGPRAASPGAGPGSRTGRTARSLIAFTDAATAAARARRRRSRG